MNDDLIRTHHHDAGGPGDRVHELFAQLADDPAPPLGFTADGLAGAGRRGARTRRFAAVTGATAGVAAVALAVAALPGAVASGSRTSAAASSSAPVIPTCSPDTKAVWETTAPDPSVNQSFVREECPALRAISQIFDPAGRRLAGGGDALDLVGDLVTGTDAAAGTGTVYGTMFGLCYHGQGSAANGQHAGCHEPSEVGIQVFFTRPGASDPESQSPEVPPADRKPGVAGATAPWHEKFTETLKDGSRVTLSEVQYGDLVSMKARRVLPSGAALTIVASNDDGSAAAAKQGSGHDRFPFTVEQMAAAASVTQFVVPYALRVKVYQVPAPSSGH
jgi:hypothetical protein